MKIQLLSMLLLSFFLLVGCSQGEEGKEGNSDQNETTTETQMPQDANADGASASALPSASNVEVSDEELEKFFGLTMKMQPLSLEYEQAMIKAIESQGLELERFGEMDKMDRNPKRELEGTPEEIERYREASKQVNKILEEGQQQIREMMVDEGFTEQRLQQINIALQKDPNLQQRFREMQQQQMQPQQPAQQ